ncbi:DoxX family membrane protein [Marivita sp. XM-24bin2]|jgi:putative oxidoreductase|nr:DoxX family membrane protein [Marivita sp. XM-24bin2]MCR9110122.1 DoxX family membrane protein [Paracoccaceae bacterium]PWL33801.1 MAG: DoxX protein [Marivita sp. XM-24bin2]
MVADLAVLFGRGLIALLFLAGAVQKTVDPEPAMLLLADRGLPPGLIWPALLFNAVAGISLLAGWAVRPVSVLLALYCMGTSGFHFIPSDPWQMSIFVKNWAIAGGCLVLAAQGPGRYVLGRAG